MCSQGFLLLAVSTLLLVSSGHCDAESEASGGTRSKVIELTEANYDEVIKNTPLILVEFYAPWCNYCQILEPKYEAAAEELSALTPPIPLARVNGDEEKNLYNRMGLNGYPVIYVFHNGRHFEYEGKRRTDAIVDFMKEEAKPDWKPPEDHVVVLTADNFTEFVSQSELMLVEFYAPWCGHCKKLAPDYARAAKELNLNHDIPLATIDATEETSLAKHFGVDGYPTLFILRHGKEYEYTGSRDRKGIVEFMVNQSTPATQEFSTRKELDLFVANQLVPVVVALLPDGEQGLLWDAYLELANIGRRTPLIFRHSSQSLVAKSLGLSPEKGDVVIARPQRFQSEVEPAFTVFEGSLLDGELSEMLSRIEGVARPLVGLRTQSTEDWWSYPMVVVYLAIDTSIEGRSDYIYWQKRLLPVAHAFEGRIHVVTSDEIEYADELGELGLKDRGEDLEIGLWAGKKEKYVMKDEFDEDSLNEFIELYFDGRLRPVLKSQRKPQQKGPVKVVVGSTFEDIVFDKTKDVLIEFYAPWCGHCKNLEPKYKQLAKKFKKYQDLVIAKFDATSNDAPPEFEFKGFPTIFFVPAGELNNVVKYEGGREVGDFTTFLEENAIHSVPRRKPDEL